MTASPSLQLVAPIVFPVETNRELPSDAIPPGAHMPPPRARVAQLEMRCGLDIETPTTNPPILAAIAVMATKWHEKRVIEYCQRSALVLIT
jgi:hypothetical protein